MDIIFLTATNYYIFLLLSSLSYFLPLLLFSSFPFFLSFRPSFLQLFIRLFLPSFFHLSLISIFFPSSITFLYFYLLLFIHLYLSSFLHSIIPSFLSFSFLTSFPFFPFFFFRPVHSSRLPYLPFPPPYVQSLLATAAERLRTSKPLPPRGSISGGNALLTSPIPR